MKTDCLGHCDVSPSTNVSSVSDRRRSRRNNVGQAELVNQLLRSRPLAETGCRIQMPDVAEVDQPAAPCTRQPLDTVKPCERVVAACCNDAEEREPPARNGKPMMRAQLPERRIA